MRHKVTLIAGEGIGPEVAAATRRIIEASGVLIDWEEIEGRTDEARENLSAAVQQYLAREPRDSPTGLAARERLARFNLEHSTDAAALSTTRADLMQIIADAGPRAIDTSEKTATFSRRT